jgi:heterodisulfide reductase subunit C
MSEHTIESHPVHLMDDIAEANSSASRGIDDAKIEHWIDVYILGKRYRVPASLTIMQAMEYAGFRFNKSVGCRAGFCGACSTMYRQKGDYRIKTALACQTMAEEGMHLVQIPFAPAVKANYDINEEPYDGNVFLKHYPELARCVSCNTCTKTCPQDLQVMDYVQAALKGDFKKVAELSFDCIQCGLCAVRCPAEIVQYHAAQLGRRMYGKYGLPVEQNGEQRVKEISDGAYNAEFEEVMSYDRGKLEEVYVKNQKEREIY